MNETALTELPVSTRPADPLRVLPTPLHMKTSTACQTNNWTAWAGYTVPSVCTSLERELTALTQHAAMADLSPTGKYEVAGYDVVRFLDHLLVADIAAVETGGAVLSPMCQSNGKVINIVTAARLDDQIWLLTCDGRHMNWLYEAAVGFEVTLTDNSDVHAGILLAGPEVSRVLKAVDLADCTDIVLRGARQIRWDGVDVTLVHRAGGTVPGLSIWCAGDEAGIVWNRLVDGEHDSVPDVVGKMALEALRVESGLPEAGRDFIPDAQAIRSDRSRTAIELGFGQLIDVDKGVFNGRAALIEERAKGSTLRLATFSFSGVAPGRGSRLYLKKGRKEIAVGVVTSTVSFLRNSGSRGLGFVDVDHVKPGDVLEVAVDNTTELLRVSDKASCEVLDVVR